MFSRVVFSYYPFQCDVYSYVRPIDWVTYIGHAQIPTYISMSIISSSFHGGLCTFKPDQLNLIWCVNTTITN